MVQNSKSLMSLLFFTAALAKAEAPCSTVVDAGLGDKGVTVNNYTNFAPLGRDDFNKINKLRNPDDPDAIRKALSEDDTKRRLTDFFNTYYKTVTDKAEARKLIASLYKKPYLPATCEQNMLNHMNKEWPAGQKPNLYIYVGGFGQQVDLGDTRIDAGEVVKWINSAERDPNALVISLGWFCEAADLMGQHWCKGKSLEYLLSEDHPAKAELIRKTKSLPTKERLWKQLDAAGKGNNTQYNESLAHVLEIGAHLIQMFLAADLGDIHLFGYSLGAHAVSEMMIFNYPNPANKEGFPWGLKGVCEKGSESDDNVCHVSELKKVKWALSLGLPGWSQALRYSKNGFRYDAALPLGYKSAIDSNGAVRRQFENGGMYRIENVTYKPFGADKEITLNYNSKLTTFNKRYDPTSVSDDPYQRGAADAVFHEYNHYGHDYNRPYLWSEPFKALLAKYLESPKVPGAIPEYGVAVENTNFDFEDCAEGSCNPASIYAAHREGQGHFNMALMKPVTKVRVATADGPEAGKKSKVLAVETNSDEALQAFTMDQEDLRGSVEFSWQPKFALGDGRVHGLFSYGSCAGVKDELMPRAYVDEQGNIVFEMGYKGNARKAKAFSVTVPKEKLLAAKVGKDKWAHLSFNWELPTIQFSRNASASEQRDYGDAIAVSNGLLKDLRNTMRRQDGQGTMSVVINGKFKDRVEAPLGAADASRDCLKSTDVLQNPNGFDILAGHFEEHNPYQSYERDLDNADVAKKDPINFGTGIAGHICKAFKIRNVPVFFGCAKSGGTNANANALMDNVRVIFGEPRQSFREVNEDGSIQSWEKLAGLEL
jgi:hypothetical protein